MSQKRRDRPLPRVIICGTQDYVRHGTTSLFAALEVVSGKIIGQCHRRHRAVEFRRFLDTIEATVPADLDVHLILNNYATHKTSAIRRWLAKRPRYHLHFTRCAGLGVPYEVVILADYGGSRKCD